MLKENSVPRVNKIVGRRLNQYKRNTARCRGPKYTRYHYIVIRIWGRHDHNADIKTTCVIHTIYICIYIHIYTYIYIYIIHLFHALNISAIPRNKVTNLKKRKQETRQNISEIWERIVDDNISLLPTIFSFVQLFSGLL